MEKLKSQNGKKIENNKSEKNIKKLLYISMLSLLSFFILTLLVLFVDVREAGDSKQLVGFATINEFIFNIFNTNKFFKILTDIFGIVSIFVMIFFACLGLYQLIKNKSLKNVDSDIYLLGAVYLLLIIIYIFFEINIVNYRPILVDGKIEASFPSSHSLLIFTVSLTSIYEINKRINNDKVKKILTIIAIAIIVITFFARFISGYHWFTDVLASAILSLSISSLFYSCIEILKSKNMQ